MIFCTKHLSIHGCFQNNTYMHPIKNLLVMTKYFWFVGTENNKLKSVSFFFNWYLDFEKENQSFYHYNF